MIAHDKPDVTHACGDASSGSCKVSIDPIPRLELDHTVDDEDEVKEQLRICSGTSIVTNDEPKKRYYDCLLPPYVKCITEYILCLLHQFQWNNCFSILKFVLDKLSMENTWWTGLQGGEEGVGCHHLSSHPLLPLFLNTLEEQQVLHLALHHFWLAVSSESMQWSRLNLHGVCD